MLRCAQRAKIFQRQHGKTDYNFDNTFHIIEVLGGACMAYS